MSRDSLNAFAVFQIMEMLIYIRYFCDVMQMAKNVYQALNDQLLDEIPKVCQLSYKLLDTCLAELVKLQTRFLQHSMQVLFIHKLKQINVIARFLNSC